MWRFFLVLVSPVGKGYSRDVDPVDKKAYFDALADTEEATQREISTKLLAVVPWYDTLNDNRLHGSSLKWENPDDPSNSRILVETLMNRKDYNDIYKPHIGEEGWLLTFSLWVTVVPEMKNFFIGKTCPPSLKRIVQLKGLNPARLEEEDPNENYSIIVELWVYPKDLFRPTPDPEITDHEGELSVKIAEGNWTFPSDFNAFLTLIDEPLYLEKGWTPPPVKYKDWFINSAQTYYDRSGDDVSKWGAPWTRLGYTYDWGNPDDRVGLSEFRILLNVDEKGVKVKLERAIDSAKPEEWDNYFRCVAEGTGGSDSGCFMKTSD